MDLASHGPQECAKGGESSAPCHRPVLVPRVLLPCFPWAQSFLNRSLTPTSASPGIFSPPLELECSPPPLPLSCPFPVFSRDISSALAQGPVRWHVPREGELCVSAVGQLWAHRWVFCYGNSTPAPTLRSWAVCYPKTLKWRRGEPGCKCTKLCPLKSRLSPTIV